MHVQLPKDPLFVAFMAFLGAVILFVVQAVTTTGSRPGGGLSGFLWPTVNIGVPAAFALLGATCGRRHAGWALSGLVGGAFVGAGLGYLLPPYPVGVAAPLLNYTLVAALAGIAGYLAINRRWLVVVIAVLLVIGILAISLILRGFYI